MSNELLFFLWAPLFLVWIGTVAVRFVPQLRERYGSPKTQRNATLIGWAALIGILVIVWVVPNLAGGGAGS